MQIDLQTMKATQSSNSDGRQSLDELLGRLEQIAASSPNLIISHGANFEVDGEIYELPRYVFIGPQAGAEPVRIGLFAGIHGDEPEGVQALVRFVEHLEAKPELAAGYCLFIYPLCNPTAYEDNTRHSRSGKDLNREFWRGSSEPEVALLEYELSSIPFQGLVSLHTDDTSHGFYGFVSGATLTEMLIEPALNAAARFVPRNDSEVIDGFAARAGVIYDGYHGVLSAPPTAVPRPFELILETPRTPSEHLKEEAFVAALETVLTEYLKVVAYAQAI